MRIVLRTQEIVRDAEAAQVAGLDEISRAMAVEAAHRAPVGVDSPGHRAGTLRDGIEPVLAERKGAGYTAGIKNDVEYSTPVEVGHHSPSGSEVPAQPHMRPAFDIYAPKTADAIKGHMP